MEKDLIDNQINETVLLFDTTNLNKWGCSEIEEYSLNKSIDKLNMILQKGDYIYIEHISNLNRLTTDVELSNITHKVKNIEYFNSKLYGTIEYFNTPSYYKFYKTLLKEQIEFIPKIIAFKEEEKLIIDSIVGFYFKGNKNDNS